jgi:FtsH-binding integral membrane protein
MSQNDRYEQFSRVDSYSDGRTIDEGLRSYMLRIYNIMTLALAVTAATSLLVVKTGLIALMFSQTAEGGYAPNLFGLIAMFSPLVVVFMFSSAVNSGSLKKVHTIFWIYSALMGLSLSPILIAYTGASVFKVFLITSATFASMSLYGYTTKKDLTSMGSFLMMGLWGVLIASIVNFFFASSMMSFVLSVLCVAIFTGLTAYDTQKFRRLYYQTDSSDSKERAAICGALNLYMDFINIFIHLLRLMGDRR